MSGPGVIAPKNAMKNIKFAPFVRESCANLWLDSLRKFRCLKAQMLAKNGLIWIKMFFGLLYCFRYAKTASQ